MLEKLRDSLLRDQVSLVCEAGGPLKQLMILDQGINCETFYITVDKISAKNLHKAHLIPERCHDKVGKMFWRELSIYKLVGPVLLIELCTRLLMLLIIERPKVVVSTGNLTIAGPAFVFAKLIGAKTIYIESIGQFEKKSTAGKILYYISDVFIVQNKETLSAYNHNAIYLGGIF